MLSLYTYLVDSYIFIVLAKNDTNVAIIVLRNHRLGIVYDTDFNNCYLILQEDQVDVVSLVTYIPSLEYYSSWFKYILKDLKLTAVATLAALYSAFPITETTVPLKLKDILVSATPNDIIMLNNVTIFGNTSSLQSVVERFPSLQEEGEFIRIV